MENLNLNLENLKYKTGENKVIEFEIDSKFKGTLSLKDLIVYKTNNEIKVFTNSIISSLFFYSNFF